MELKNKTKKILLKNKLVKRLNVKFKAKKFYDKGLKTVSDPERILFWSTGGMLIQTNLEAVIGASLKLRGHKVNFVLCDGVYKACAKRVDHPEVGIKDWGKYCKSCIRQNSELLDKLGLDHSFISEHISDEKIKELRELADKITFENYKELSHKKINHSNHLESAMMRHTKGGSFEGHEEILKEYAFAILVVAEAAENSIKKYKPAKAYMSHGIYADWGPALSVILKKNIPTTSYVCCYLNAHFYFGTITSFKKTFLNIDDSSWEHYKIKELKEKQINRLMNFTDRRYLNNVSQDMKGLLKEYTGDKEFFCRKYDIDPKKPVWGVMTHINWDAVSDYFPMLHKNFDEWLYETIKVIRDTDEVQWLIKIHPSEINDNPLTGCQKFIEKNFPDLPSHIKVVKMDDDISPRDFYGLLDGAVTVMGTGGLELSMLGKPVILAGEAHYSGKGFTYDAKSREHYDQLLRDVKNIKRNSEEMLKLSLKYGYIYFILKQIPLLPTIKDDLYIDFEKLNFLFPGKNKFMDFICDRIIDGGDFILSENLAELNHTDEKEQINEFL
ncbi:MAG TPA: hypothetical protein PKD83_01155 [Ignavibacteria bacterium]|nr:hypothetical protein [Ignavibacteria bacterium]